MLANTAKLHLAGTVDLPDLRTTGGTLDFADVPLTQTVDHLAIQGGDVSFARDRTIPDLDLHSGSLGGVATVTVTHEMYWRGGDQKGDGTTRIADGGQLRVLDALDGSAKDLRVDAGRSVPVPRVPSRPTLGLVTHVIGYPCVRFP